MKVSCLAVGYGGVARRMTEIFKDLPWFEIADVVDPSPERLGAAEDDLELPSTSLHHDFEQALAESDANVVMINTPSEMHTAQVRRALENDRHVLVAKPFTLDLAEAEDLVQLAEERGLNLSVAQQIRYNRHYTVVRDFLRTGAIGRVEQIMLLSSKPRHGVRNLAQITQPVLYEMSCHHFDCLLSLLPDLRPRSIMIDGYKPTWSAYGGPSMINGLIQSTDGVHLLYHAGYSARADCYELRLEGSSGALRCRGRHMSNEAVEYEKAGPEGIWESIALDEGIEARDPFIPFAERWHAYLSGGDEPPFSGRRNLKPLAMVQAGVESAVTGRPVTFEGNGLYRRCLGNPK